MESSTAARIKACYAFFALVERFSQKLEEIDDKLQCLQRAVAASCACQGNFKAEHAEDIAEVKRKLDDIRRSQLWFARERA